VLEQRLKKLCGKETTALKAWLTAQEDAHAKRDIQKHQPNLLFCAYSLTECVNRCHCIAIRVVDVKKREKLGNVGISLFRFSSCLRLA